jgi:hypothetical protein
MPNIKRSPFFWPSFLLILGLAGYGGAAIIQAIVPAAAPTASRRGTTTPASGAGIFQLAANTTAGSVGAAVCDDGNGNTTTSGCTANAVTSTSPVTVNANSTNDQQLMELSLSAGYLNSLGRPFDIFGAGLYTTQTAQTPTLELKVKLCTVSGCGSGTVVTLVDITTGATTAATSNVSWNLRTVAVTAATGATGNLEVHGRSSVDLGSAISTAATVYNDISTAVSSNIDLTAALFVDFTIKFSTNAATANIFIQRSGVVSPGGSTSGGGGGSGPSITQGTFASLPGTCTTNDLYYQTDGPYQFRCSAANTFSAFLPSWGLVTVPPSASWTSDNMSTTTVDSTNGERYFANSPNAANTVRLQYRTAPATPYAIVGGIRHELTGIASTSTSTNGLSAPCMFFRDGTGKIESLCANFNSTNSTTSMDVSDWTNSTTFSATVKNFNMNGAEMSGPLARQTVWFCLTDDGTTNITKFVSIDRQHWIQFSQTSRTAFFGSGPTQAGWGNWTNGNAVDEALIDWTLNTAATCK